LSQTNKVSITFKLESLISRIALLIVVLLVCGAMSWLIFSHFIIRVVDDNRVILNRAGLNTTLTRLPGSPRINYRLAKTEMADGIRQSQLLQSAQAHAQKAVNLSIWDYRNWRLLASIQESNNDPENAEKSLRAAAKLAPNNLEVNWELANLLLRRGKLDESLEPFRKATTKNDELLPLALDLIWQFSGNNRAILKTLASNDPMMQLSLVQFFLDQSLVNESLSTFRSIEREAKFRSSKSAGYVNSLIKAEQYEVARAVWLDLIKSSVVKPDSQGTNLIWNGSFELDPIQNYNHFNWAIGTSQFARIGFDKLVARRGSRSLKVAFTGRDTTSLNGEIKQLVVLRPGVRYHLECYAKTGDLLTPEGPRIALMNRNGLIATSQPVLERATDWQLLSVDFVAPQDTSPVFVAIVRIPKFSYDEPTRGSIWFDDFSLSELAPAE
jgi:tetratricopeptide (TPR) repeat protein